MSDILSFISTDESLCQRYTVHGVVPTRVAIPPDSTAMSAVLHTAAQQGWTVVAWGGGTHQLIGAPPTQVDLVVVTTALNRVLQHEPNDLTIAVEAGMTMGALRAYLAQHGQMLPVDPALPDQTTIGGMIATAADGPRRAYYGILRDMMIGIGVVEVNGQTSRAGGMVVKNVSGFDMMKLYHGSFGTLAVIVSANFKLIPIPPVTATVVAAFAQRDHALDYVTAIMASQLTPVTLELLDAALLQRIGVAGAWGVALACEGPQAAVDRHVTELSHRATIHAGAPTFFHHHTHTQCWQTIADASAVASLAEGEMVVRWVTLPAFVGDVVQRIGDLGHSLGGNPQIHVRASIGVGYVRLTGLTTASQQQWFAALPEAVWVATQANDLASYWHTPVGGLEVMTQIRHEFDPLQRFNPRRFVV
ncbi:MAG: FAD-binding oxidoreductase [Chloroflexia bacterium]|nr:FAD-binding oxidoreductase [Chloroflexia bacterium]